MLLERSETEEFPRRSLPTGSGSYRLDPADRPTRPRPLVRHDRHARRTRPIRRRGRASNDAHHGPNPPRAENPLRSRRRPRRDRRTPASPCPLAPARAEPIPRRAGNGTRTEVVSHDAAHAASETTTDHLRSQSRAARTRSSSDETAAEDQRARARSDTPRASDRHGSPGRGSRPGRPRRDPPTDPTERLRPGRNGSDRSAMVGNPAATLPAPPASSKNRPSFPRGSPVAVLRERPSISPRLRLQGRHEATRFVGWSGPPRARGMTWSTSVARAPHHWQR